MDSVLSSPLPLLLGFFFFFFFSNFFLPARIGGRFHECLLFRSPWCFEA